MKRRLVTLLLLLVGGAIVNVAVAWGFAWYAIVARPVAAKIIQTPVLLSDGECLMAFVEKDKPWPGMPGAVPAWVIAFAGSTVQVREARMISPRFIEEPHARHFQPSWVVLTEYSAGWPFLAMRGWSIGAARSPSGDAPPVRSALVIPAGRPQQFIPPILPLRPVWPGSAINTVLYAVILWMIFVMPFVLRRQRRIKRGLCVKCAYPVGASDVCTECGASVVSTRQPPGRARG